MRNMLRAGASMLNFLASLIFIATIASATKCSVRAGGSLTFVDVRIHLTRSSTNADTRSRGSPPRVVDSSQFLCWRSSPSVACVLGRYSSRQPTNSITFASLSTHDEFTTGEGGRVRVPRRNANSTKSSAPMLRDLGESLSSVLARKGSVIDGCRAIQRMVDARVSVNIKTFNMLMTICVHQVKEGKADLQDAFRIVELSTARGVKPDTILYNGVMSCCAKAAGRGRATIQDGSNVLQTMKAAGIRPDHVTLNTLLDVCAKAAGHRTSEGVPVTPMTGFSVLSLLQDDGLVPTVVTFTTLMHLVSRCAAHGRARIADGLEVISRMEQSGVQPSLQLCNALMDVVAKSARHGEAGIADGHGVLRRMRAYDVRPSVVTFNSLLEVYVHCAGRKGRATVEDGWEVLRQMEAADVKPDTITFNTLLHLCAQEASVGAAGAAEAAMVEAAMEKEGCVADMVTYSTMLDVIAKAARSGAATVRDAQAVLQRMQASGYWPPGPICSNSFLQCARADGSEAAVQAAEELLAAMPREQRDSYTYSALLGLLGGAGCSSRALQVLDEALADGVRWNVYMFNAAMGTCAAAGEHKSVLALEARMRKAHVAGDALTRRHLAHARAQLALGGSGRGPLWSKSGFDES